MKQKSILSNGATREKLEVRKTMTVGDILVSINQASLETMLPLTAVQTNADIERYYKEGYSVGLTANEFAKKYPRLPISRIYAARNMLAPLYYCELDNPPFPSLFL